MKRQVARLLFFSLLGRRWILTIPLPRRHNDRGTTLCSTASASLRHYRSGGNYLAFASRFLLPIRQAPYTDPASGLRYHDKSVYEIVKGLVSVILDLKFYA